MERIKAGTSIQIKLKTLVKLSQLQHMDIRWGQIRKTQSFLKYFGPSSARYISASQVARAATKIASEMSIEAWQEGQPGEFGALLNDIIHQGISRREKAELDLSKLTDPSQFQLDVGKFQDQTDVIKRIATDAKTLSDQEWCNKYHNALDTMSKSSASANDATSAGLDVTIPVDGIPIPLGGDYSSTSSSSSATASAFKTLLETQNCGKNYFEKAFKYEFDGSVYIPKSIYVYERNMTEGSISDSIVVHSYIIKQRYGTIEHSIMSRMTGE